MRFLLPTLRAELCHVLLSLTLVFLILQFGAALSLAQQTDPTSQGDLSQGVLRIPVEEVRVPVFATDERGRFDTDLSASTGNLT